MAIGPPVGDAERMKPARSVHPSVPEEAARSPHVPPADAPLLLGAAEFAAYEQEVARLRDLRDRELPERLRAARGFVAADAAEEIAHIQEEQAIMDARIARLEDLLSGANVLLDGPAADIATVGSTVEVEYRRTGRRATYRLTGAASGSDAGGVSARSPVGQALMGRRAGEIASAELPGGRVEQLHVVAIRSELGDAP